MANKANLDVSEKLDITIRRGDSFELSINIKDNEGNNLPLLTDNYEFVIQIKTPVTSSRRGSQAKRTSSLPQRSLVAASSLQESTTQDVPKDQSAESPIFVFENKDDNGNVTLRATAANTATLPVGVFVYDLQYKHEVNGFENVTTILKGNFTVKEDISTLV
jgi:hypothetical protein